MLKAPDRQDRVTKTDPEFALNLARAVARMGRVNSRIAKISERVAKRAISSIPRILSSEQRLVGTLLDAFETSSDESRHSCVETKELTWQQREVALRRAKRRAAARVAARLRLANMYRRFVQRRYSLTWEDVLKQE